MPPPVADGAPTANEGEGDILAETVEIGVGIAVREDGMEVGAVAAVTEPDQVEPEEAVGADPQADEVPVEPEEATVTGAERDDEDAEEDMDEEEDDDPEEEEEYETQAEEDMDEEEDDDPEEEEEYETQAGDDEESIDEDAVMEPQAVVKTGEVQQENESEEPEDEEENEEPNEVDEESEEVDVEEAEDGAKGLVHGSMADDVNEKIEGEHVKCGDKDMNEVADISSNGNDAGGSRNGDMQSSEFAGGLELLVDDLPKNCVEEDIAMAFSKCGEVKSIRIIRNSSTEKGKDIAFVCFASTEAAKEALTIFNKGIEVKGIKVRVSACQNNNTLFLGNISKSWTKNQVLTALNNIGIQECDISLPCNVKGKNRGFAFLKYGSHNAARAAFYRLLKPDAIFGPDRTVTVSFYKEPTKRCTDLMEAKRVYLEHVPISWNEDKIRECCEEYGKVLNIDLFQISKNMKSETVSFIEFSSSKSALACLEGINNANIVDGSLKLSACLARPKSSATSEDAKTSKKTSMRTEKVCMDKNSLQKLPKGNKGNLNSRAKVVAVKGNAPSNKLIRDRITSQDAVELPQISKPSEGERKHGKNKNTSVYRRPSKKARNNWFAGNVDGSNLTTYQSTAVLQTSSHSNKGKRRRGKDVIADISDRPLKKAHSNSNARRPNRTRGTGQTAGPQYSRAHHSLHGSSRAQAYASDLEPHAGYIPPANQVHNTYTYDQRRIGQNDIHPRDVQPYARETALSRSTYSDYKRSSPYQTQYEYIHPPPHSSGSYYQGRGPFINRRGDYY